MDAKDKAMELFNSFEADLMEADVYYLEMAKKRCALIAVDFAKEFITGDLSESFDKFLYLEDVKTEINKLWI